jgi:hypothetical protein
MNSVFAIALQMHRPPIPAGRPDPRTTPISYWGEGVRSGYDAGPAAHHRHRDKNL